MNIASQGNVHKDLLKESARHAAHSYLDDSDKGYKKFVEQLFTKTRSNLVR